MTSSQSTTVVYVSPEKEVYTALWILFTAAAIFVGLRVWSKYTRRNELWYDDYMLVLSLLVLMVTDIIVTCQYATGYVTNYWHDRMHILINLSTGGTLFGQAWSKTALAITLLRISNKKQLVLLWFCIITMNLLMIVKVFFQWAKYCGKDDYQQWYRLQGPCVNYEFEQRLKVAGNTYNIVMDFIFACFPWWITWHLRIRGIEKIALCTTMSLGMFIAIISAIRTAWAGRPIMHRHDEMFIWRDGLSTIWFSGEVAGTIIVQCIPVLRPLIRDVHTLMNSQKLDDTENGTRRAPIDPKRGLASMNSRDKSKNGMKINDIALNEMVSHSSRSETHQASVTAPEEPHADESSWPLAASGSAGMQTRGRHDTWIEDEEKERGGLSP
ncbi:hypothetical protein BP5796_04529 [Coleophoma crateriformis]|uniref:Rhodopsin domain-containing protein n=1 Tax=Coleophoma crateriformis TaxID=565419 RepID=A0A3D8SBA4_9HELO|nr:hypothetical protein BP5796_04529 [Coleophoma crateriformis]